MGRNKRKQEQFCKINGRVKEGQQRLRHRFCLHSDNQSTKPTLIKYKTC